MLTSFVPFILGMLIVLFFKCMTSLLSPAHRRGERIKWGLVSYTVIMFSLATVLTGMDLNIQSISHIDNRNFPGVKGKFPPGPYGYLMSIYYQPINYVPTVVFILTNWLADGLLVSSLFDGAFACANISDIGSSSSSIVATWSILRTFGSLLSPFSRISPPWVCARVLHKWQ